MWNFPLVPIHGNFGNAETYLYLRPLCFPSPFSLHVPLRSRQGAAFGSKRRWSSDWIAEY
jgi:hypothetical protein